MADFTVYPAIDLRQGRVVRLAQGDPGRETTYSQDPLQVARQWEQAGAQWIHVVNLDGAFGDAAQETARALAKLMGSGLSLQVGGGLRDLSAISRALELGASRVVLGTAFVEDPDMVASALMRFGPDRVAVGIDAREGIVQIRGWQAAASWQATDLAQRWAAMGGRWLIFTDISRDGMGRGVNIAATEALAKATALRVIASGGVRTLADVQRVREAGLAGVIIGRALYEGQIVLRDALDVVEEA